MDEIRPWLFIGTYRDTINIGYLKLKSIKAMLQLAEPVEQENIDSLYLHVDDLRRISGENIRQGVDFIRKHKNAGHKILVACGAGVNRASAFSIAALKEEEGLNLVEAFRSVKQLHPDTMPNPLVWMSLCEHYNEPNSYLTIVRLGSTSPLKKLK
jgi:protein-tyrosine phosphatase